MTRSISFADDEREGRLCAADFLRFHDFCHDTKQHHGHDADFPETREA